MNILTHNIVFIYNGGIKMNFTIDIIEESLLNTFKEIDLSYLALTSRSEGTFRDLFALHLQNTFEKEQILVSREFRTSHHNSTNNLPYNGNGIFIDPKKLYIKNFVDLLILQYSETLEKRAFIEFGWNYSTEYLYRSQQIRNKIIKDFGKNLSELIKENEKIKQKVRDKNLRFYQVMFIVDFDIKLNREKAFSEYGGVIRHLFDNSPDSNLLFQEMNMLHKDIRIEDDNLLLEEMQLNAFGDKNNPKLNFLYEDKREGKLGKLWEFKDFKVQMYYIIIEKEWCKCDNPTDITKWNFSCSSCKKESIEAMYEVYMSPSKMKPKKMVEEFIKTLDVEFSMEDLEECLEHKFITKTNIRSTISSLTKNGNLNKVGRGDKAIYTKAIL